MGIWYSIMGSLASPLIFGQRLARNTAHVVRSQNAGPERINEGADGLTILPSENVLQMFKLMAPKKKKEKKIKFKNLRTR